LNKMYRYIIGFIVTFPFIWFTYLVSIFLGKKHAIKIAGPLLTKMAKQCSKGLLPKINDSSEYPIFKRKLKRNIERCRWLYDYTITIDDERTMQFNFYNCPFCETLQRFGLPEMGTYMCAGDWEATREHLDKYKFSRQNQIGKGDAFCNHTYINIIRNK